MQPLNTNDEIYFIDKNGKATTTLNTTEILQQKKSSISFYIQNKNTKRKSGVYSCKVVE